MQFDDNQKVTFIALAFALFIGFSWYAYKNIFLVEKPKDIVVEQKKAQIFVHISGSVKNEGVYKVDSGSRIYEVIKVAGGAYENADFSSINLAEVVKDGQKIEISSLSFKKEEESLVQNRKSSQKSSQKSKKISINKGNIEDLDSLPGVGKATAQKIIDNRPFAKIEDLLKIDRFGKSRFEKIKDRVSL